MLKDNLRRLVSAIRIAPPLVIDLVVIGIVEPDAREPDVFGDTELALQYLRSKEGAEYLEYYDTLRGLPKRALNLTRMQSALEAARKNGQSVTVAVIDVVEFGPVNDNLGQHLSDSLASAAGRRSATRPP